MDDLDLPSQVMRRLIEIPRLKERLECHQTILSWEDAANQLEVKLNVIGEAGMSTFVFFTLAHPTVAELRNESHISSLKEFLSLILAVGLIDFLFVPD